MILLKLISHTSFHRIFIFVVSLSIPNVLSSNTFLPSILPTCIILHLLSFLTGIASIENWEIYRSLYTSSSRESEEVPENNDRIFPIVGLP